MRAADAKLYVNSIGLLRRQRTQLCRRTWTSGGESSEFWVLETHKSEKTLENRHPKTSALRAFVRLRIDGAFSGASFRVFWKANPGVSGGGISTFDHPKKTPASGAPVGSSQNATVPS